MTARPASNAAIHASRVSNRVPSISKRTVSIRRTSGLLLAEAPNFVADVMDRLDRLAFLLAGHRRPVHEGATHSEGTPVLLVAYPDDVSRPDPGIGLDDSRGHDVRPVVDEPDRPHVDDHRAFRRRECEEPTNRRSDPAFDEERDRFVLFEEETPRTGLGLVQRPVVDGHNHPEFLGEPTEKIRGFFPAEPCPPSNLEGHPKSAGMRGT